MKDNGCGISKENLKNIFNPYYTNKPGELRYWMKNGISYVLWDLQELKYECSSLNKTRYPPLRCVNNVIFL